MSESDVRRTRVRGSSLARRRGGRPLRTCRSLVAAGALVVGSLIAAACGGSDGTAQTSPTPTAVIDPAPTPAPAEATSTPATTPPATATPVPTPPPTPTEVPPTPTVERTPEEQAVLTAWERYLDLGFAVRGKAPSPEALDFDSYVSGGARERLEELLVEQANEGYYVEGSVSSVAPQIDQRSGDLAIVDDCAVVKLDTFDATTDEILQTQDEVRIARGRVERLAGHWLITEFEAGEACSRP